jgi:Fe-S-cluster containining protein
MVLPVVKPLQKSIMVDWLDARGCKVVKETNDTIYVEIDSPCPHLTKSGNKFSCEIYYQRPQGCRIFDGSKFDFLDCAWKDNYVILEKGR